MGNNRTICVGQFVGAHGVRGLVKLRSFTENPEMIFEYAPLSDGKGRVFVVRRKSLAHDHFLVEVDGIANKEDADELRGDKIFVSRDVLPATKPGEFYEADLIGLAVIDADGKTYGAILDVHDHGAGTFIEIGTNKKDSFMLPFKDVFVPLVDFDAGKATVMIPEGWLTKEKPPTSQ
jgi:16S rRNA processing protein RimM